VIVPTYNSRVTLRCALESLLAQEFSDFEAWIVGDSCTDGSEEEIVKLADARLHWINLAQNTGSQWRPNNEGLLRARGRYVAYLGHDDLWLPWHLSALITHAENRGADLVHDLLVNLAPEGILDVAGPPAHGVGYERHGFPPSSWLHRRELIDKVGLWRDPMQLTWNTDYDFTRRVYIAGLRIEFVPSLGAVKFPAAHWRNYRATGQRPQPSHLEAMLRNPVAFAEKILVDSAVSFSRRTDQGAKEPLPLALRDAVHACARAFKVFIRAALDLYGRERWPLRPLLRKRMQRILGRSRVARGLSTKV
ncbi:MAG: glycosyltransferase family 2 protein, partial [Verrucomicrobiota bacterium]|nr:glycosyltransferase family 2 protein [Verrucomicrobiota bacterium]